MVVGNELHDLQPVLLPCEIDIAAADGIHHIGQRRQRSQSSGVEIARRQQDVIEGERALSSAQVRADALGRLRSDDREIIAVGQLPAGERVVRDRVAVVRAHLRRHGDEASRERIAEGLKRSLSRAVSARGQQQQAYHQCSDASALHTASYRMMVFVTSGSAAITSVGFMAYSPMRAAHTSPARPCSQTAVCTASRAGIWHSSAPSMPASTSPLPPLAIPGLPARSTAVSPSGNAQTVSGPLRTTVQPCAAAKADAASALPAASAPASRANSPSCGVRTMGARARLSTATSCATAKSASASSTSGVSERKTTACTSAVSAAFRPKPGPSTHTSLLRSRSSSSGSASAASLPSADGSGNGIAASFFTAVIA